MSMHLHESSFDEDDNTEEPAGGTSNLESEGDSGRNVNGEDGDEGADTGELDRDDDDHEGGSSRKQDDKALLAALRASDKVPAIEELPPHKGGNYDSGDGELVSPYEFLNNSHGELLGHINVLRAEQQRLRQAEIQFVSFISAIERARFRRS